MLKLVMTLVGMAFIGFVQAQSFKFSVGYGFPWLSQDVGINSATTSTTILDPETNSAIQSTIDTRSRVRGSFAAGWNFNGAFTYKLSEYIGLELGISYITGKEYTTSSSYSDIRMTEMQNFSFEKETSKSRAILFTPSLKFMTQRRIFTPYFFVGPVLGKINFTRDFESLRQQTGISETEDRTTKFSGGVSLGLRGAVGVSVEITKKLSVFSEVVFTGMNYYPKESEITRYDINGENKLNTLTAKIRKTVYLNEVNTDTGNTQENDPNKSLRFPVSMSSLSTNMGVLIRLN